MYCLTSKDKSGKEVQKRDVYERECSQLSSHYNRGAITGESVVNKVIVEPKIINDGGCSQKYSVAQLANENIRVGQEVVVVDPINKDSAFEFVRLVAKEKPIMTENIKIMLNKISNIHFYKESYRDLRKIIDDIIDGKDIIIEQDEYE